MRKRIIKPQFWESEKVANLDYPARLLFIGLWQIADRHGHLRLNPRIIQSKIFPYDRGADVPTWIEQIRGQGLIEVWHSQANGHDVVTINGFAEHQTIHPKEAESEYETEYMERTT